MFSSSRDAALAPELRRLGELQIAFDLPPEAFEASGHLLAMAQAMTMTQIRTTSPFDGIDVDHIKVR